MKYFLIYNDLVLHPRAVLRVPEVVDNDLLEKYLERRNLRALSIPCAVLSLNRKLGSTSAREIQIKTDSVFKYEIAPFHTREPFQG
jgi:hypothetical protein